ncbi:response regulator [Paraburkholderia madseniana]|uniref:Response regulator n=1 Tax=Paraburkholderia madseniana TaxID=2599607 RepID=A0A6N6WF38_9BURK|nr:response regulator transcription factor [Paraburkholderia madseniana]KAE8758404.1 response regulator [Paraburkholderia madseniana]
MRIAIVHDKPVDLEFITATLAPAGHDCHAFSSGHAFIHRLQRESFDLVTLDWNLAGMPGDAVLRWIRENCPPRLPVMFISNRSAEIDIVAALTSDADDYVVKPVPSAVLLARVTNLLRSAWPQHRSEVETFGDYEFGLAQRSATLCSQPVALSTKEFDLALLFFRNIGRPLSHAHIFEMVWKHSPEILTRTLSTHVSAVRVKLDLRPQNGYCIVPIYSYGYRLEKIARRTAPLAPPEAEVHTV